MIRIKSGKLVPKCVIMYTTGLKCIIKYTCTWKIENKDLVLCINVSLKCYLQVSKNTML